MMIRKPLDLPLAVAHAFVDAMNDYFAVDNPTKRDAVAAHQLSVLDQYRGPRDGPLRLGDIKVMFPELKGLPAPQTEKK